MQQRHRAVVVQLLAVETTVGGNGQSLKHPHKVHCKNRAFDKKRERSAALKTGLLASFQKYGWSL